MNSFIKSRVVKSQAVEVSIPRLVENNFEGFQLLGGHLAVVRDVMESETGVVSFGSSIEPLGEQKQASIQEADRSELMNQTKAEAQSLLEKAEAEAEHIRAQAQVEADELKQRISEEVTAKAQAEGYEKGFAQGQAEGYAAGKTQGEHEVAEKVEQAQMLLHRVQNAAQEEFKKVDNDLLHLSLMIAERVARASLNINPELLKNQIKALTLFPQEREGWRLHVSPEDFVWLQKTNTETKLNLTYVADDTLHPGDSFLECSEGIFDSRLDLQLSHLEQLLGEELNHEGLEQTGR
ncbi:FliH/SctL family protein [Desulfitobacterium metallireducens]|uniref:Flagellar assembly protein FliH n=1 Tax=Desulfitobacterium metallireducens DSM 15288 TaxID=871968 RepID=W0EAL0_9FIRM|nr:FliH/SctL family protein [Desulfitobacterium metallireducens]AHF07787.1 flagellar assembly protein FliH [Desulfitobacterium metallireducens DSM 15288]